MNPKNIFSTKRFQIDKANATMIAVLAASIFLVIFSRVAGKALLGQRSYQAKVIDKKEKARDQLKSNIDQTKTLVTSYKSFTDRPENVLGGNPAGQGEKDGDNAKIILDALPSKYDFPALATSMDKLLGQVGVKGTFSGTDDVVAQEAKASSNNPQVVDIPVTISADGSLNSIKDLINVFEKSIRPFNISMITFSGNDGKMTTSITAKTHYQPQKVLTISTEVVK